MQFSASTCYSFPFEYTGKSKGRDHFGGQNNIKLDLKELGCKDLDWIHLAQCRVPW